MLIDRLKKPIFAITPLLLLASMRLDIFLPYEGDKGWLVHAARKWLEGNTLYGSIFEVNPPLIVWIYAIPVWLSMHVGWIADTEALGVIGIIACLFSTWVGTELIALHPAFEGNKSRQVQFAFLQLLIFIFFNMQSYFFDREHILIVLGFPYMIRFMPQLAERAIPRRLKIITGLMAALAFCIKPHAMLIFAVLQLFTLLRARSFKALLTLENGIVAGFTAFYVLIIWLTTPDYFYYVLPMAFDTYETFRNEGTDIQFLPPFFFGFFLIFIDFRSRHDTPYRRDVLYLVGLCAAFIAYSEINNGWPYTYNPIYCMLMLLAGWMIWEYNWLRREYERQNMAPRNVAMGLRGCFLVFIGHGAYMIFYLTLMNTSLDRIRQPCYSNPECYHGSHYLTYFSDHHVRSFGTMSFDFSNWVALQHLSNTDWDTRFNHLWMLPKLILDGDPFARNHYWIVEYVAKGLSQDMNINKPDVMMVDSSPGLIGRDHPYNLVRYLSAVPEFKEAWSHYRFRLTFEGCGENYRRTASECRYDLYSRVP